MCHSPCWLSSHTVCLFLLSVFISFADANETCSAFIHMNQLSRGHNELRHPETFRLCGECGHPLLHREERQKLFLFLFLLSAIAFYLCYTIQVLSLSISLSCGCVIIFLSLLTLLKWSSLRDGVNNQDMTLQYTPNIMWLPLFTRSYHWQNDVSECAPVL